MAQWRWVSPPRQFGTRVLSGGPDGEGDVFLFCPWIHWPLKHACSPLIPGEEKKSKSFLCFSVIDFTHHGIKILVIVLFLGI